MVQHFLLILFVLLLLVRGAMAHPGGHGGQSDGEGKPKISVGVIRHAPSCTDDQRVKLNSYTTIDLQLFTDISKKERREVMKLEGKLLRSVGGGASLIGLERGIIGACVGETRSIRIPAALGFQEDGNKRVNVPPDTPLRAIVVIKSSYMPTNEELQNEHFYLDADFNNYNEETLSFPSPVVEVNDTTFTEIIKDKHAFFMLYAPWSDSCKEVQPDFVKVAEAFSSESDVVLVAADASANEKLADIFDVNAYPTNSLLKATGNIIPYREKMTALRIVMFLNKELKKNVPLP